MKAIIQHLFPWAFQIFQKIILPTLFTVAFVTKGIHSSQRKHNTYRWLLLFIFSIACIGFMGIQPVFAKHADPIAISEPIVDGVDPNTAARIMKEIEDMVLVTDRYEVIPKWMVDYYLPSDTNRRDRAILPPTLETLRNELDIQFVIMPRIQGLYSVTIFIYFTKDDDLLKVVDVYNPHLDSLIQDVKNQLAPYFGPDASKKVKPERHRSTRNRNLIYDVWIHGKYFGIGIELGMGSFSIPNMNDTLFSSNQELTMNPENFNFSIGTSVWLTRFAGATLELNKAGNPKLYGATCRIPLPPMMEEYGMTFTLALIGGIGRSRENSYLTMDELSLYDITSDTTYTTLDLPPIKSSMQYFDVGVSTIFSVENIGDLDLFIKVRFTKLSIPLSFALPGIDSFESQVKNAFFISMGIQFLFWPTALFVY